MRFLPTRVHGAIDYLWGVVLIAAPWLLGMPEGGAAMWVAIAFGAGAIVYSLVTDYELGLLRLMPMSLHLTADAAAGALLAASPWLFGFSGETWWPHLFFGLFAIVASLVTETRPRSPVLQVAL